MTRHRQHPWPCLGAGVVLLLALAVVPASADIAIWDTGAPHQVVTSGLTGYYGLAAAMPGTGRGWLAVPFKIDADTAITQVDVDWYIRAGYEGTTIKYIIWNRTGLTAPTTQHASGDLGAFAVGIDDPRVPGDDVYLHQYTGLSIPIAAGNYYFTMYADGIGAGNTYGHSRAYWQLGGDLQPEELEQAFIWRQTTGYPPANFVAYNAMGVYTPGPGMTDSDDIWNATFKLYAVPEPASLAALGLGLAALAARRRSRR